ncbi:MAG: hypothetical protein ACXWOV_09070 [Isosphaeraceae bacterium]
MVAFDESSDQWRSASPRGPVFVDASGRRLRGVKLIGLGALGLVAGYVILLLVAFIGGSNVAAPFLPLPAAPAAPAARDLPSSPAAPASPAAGLQASEPRSAQPAARAAVEAPVTAVRAPVTVVQAQVASAGPLAPPIDTAARQPAAPVATPAPSTPPTAPGMSGAAPGQTTRPSAPPHP